MPHLLRKRRTPPPAGTTLSLLRLRLLLTVLAVAAMPLALITALLAIGRIPMRIDPLLGLLAMLLLLVVLMTVLLARGVLRSAEQLEDSRAELHRLYEAARADSLLDALTGLGNHRAFQEEIERQVALCLRYDAPFALLLIDVDEFKQVNDSRGHAGGDDLLARLAGLIRGSIRDSDRAFRVGGDEFAVLMPRTDENGAYAVARRLLASALQPEESGLGTSFSAGISAAPTLGTSRPQLYAQADAALYSAKRHGRTVVEVYDAARHGVVAEGPSGEVSTAIADVAEHRALAAVYQPIVELSTGRVVGYEGLVRPNRESAFTDTGSLFAAAEAVGRTFQLDEACLEVIASAAKSLPAGCFLSVNISPRTLESPEFAVPRLLKVLGRHGLTPERVVLELTERQDPEDLERMRRRLDACREAGFRVAVDDVGAGNAGLRLLSEVHFDVVKVDLSLVQGGAQRASSLDVVRSIAALAGRWGAYLIAEGIETQEQLQTVRALRVDAAQGYLLGQPSETFAAEPVDLDGLASGDYWVKQLLRQAGVTGQTSGPH